MPITFTLTEIILLITNTLAVGYALHYWDAHRKASFFLENIFTDLDFRQSEEVIKREMYDTARGLLWCVANTTLYNLRVS